MSGAKKFAIKRFIAVICFPLASQAAQIDEIAYLTNRTLKELSTKAVTLFTSPSLGLCGRRRELKITERGSSDKWPEIIQSILKRDSPLHRVVRMEPVLRSNNSVTSALNKFLLDAGYHSETPSETDATVANFKAGIKASYGDFLVYSGQVKGADSASRPYSFFALADEKLNELLLVCLGEDFCR